MKRHPTKFTRYRRRQARAVSPVIATVLLIAATVVIAMAVWAWTNTAAANAQHDLGQTVANDMNSVSERFSIITSNVTYSGGSKTSSNIAIWFYNSGTINTTISYIMINGTSYNNNGAGWPLPKNQLIMVTVAGLTPQITKGDLQKIKAGGVYGYYFNYQLVA